MDETQKHREIPAGKAPIGTQNRTTIKETSMRVLGWKQGDVIEQIIRGSELIMRRIKESANNAGSAA